MLNDYLNLDGLASQLALPRTYLRRLADSGKIPYIDTGNKRRRFSEQAVRDALSKIERETIKQNNSQAILGDRR